MSFINGANLGNWLVLEKWMSPQTFSGSDADDEFYLPRTISRDDYVNRISASALLCVWRC